EGDRDPEGKERDHDAVVVRDRFPNHGADHRAGESDRQGQPDGHRVRPGDREAGKRAGQEPGQENRNDDAERHTVVAVVDESAIRSRRRLLISSRSFAAYSKRSSSAAWNISSSSVISSFSRSSRFIPSTLSLPRRRERGTLGASSVRNSAMSETPLVI